MVGPIVQHVAALAQAFQVARMVVRRVVVEMGGGEHDAGNALRGQISGGGAGTAPASAVPPVPHGAVEPASVGQAGHGLAVRAAARLAPTPGASEADGAAQLGPVDRVDSAAPGGPASGGDDHAGKLNVMRCHPAPSLAVMVIPPAGVTGSNLG